MDGLSIFFLRNLDYFENPSPLGGEPPQIVRTVQKALM